MKKFFTLALALTTLVVSAFADNTNSVNQKVLNTFNKSFNNAELVSWEVKSDLYKVTFRTGGKTMYAYYNHDGEQVAVSRNLHMDQLPLTLSLELKEKFNDSWLTSLFEVASTDETAYYATVENSTHITIYKAVGTTGWAVFKKDKKK